MRLFPRCNSLFLLLGFVASALQGQGLFEPHYIHFTVEDGLPSNNVFYVFQDSRRNIWLGTDRGLCRFDGQNMTTYTPQDGLSDNEVIEVYEDTQGRIWPLTTSGRISFYHNGKFYNSDNTPSLKGFKANNYASAWYEDASGNVYLGFMGGSLARIDRQNQLWDYTNEYDNNASSIAEIGADENGRVVALTSPRKLMYLDDPTKTLHTISDKMVHGSENSPFKAIFTPQHKFEFVWGRERAYLRDDLKQLEYFPNQLIPLGQKSICLIQDKRGRLWMGTTDGIHLLGPERLEGHSIRRFLPGKQVSSVCIDHEGGYWFSTTEGVFYAPYPEIQHFRLPASTTEEEEASAVFCEPDGYVLAGFRDGKLFRLNARLDEATLVHADLGNIPVLVQRFPGEIWASGLKGTYSIVNGNATMLSERHFRDIAFVNPDSLCICTANNLIPMPVRDFRALFYKSAFNLGTPSQRNRRCLAVHVDSLGQVWLANTDGISRLSGSDTTRIAEFLPWLKKSSATSIRTYQNEIWVGTNGSGLLWYTEGKVYPLTGAAGLVSDQINSIDIDPQGNIWIASSNGLQQLVRGQDGRFHGSPMLRKEEGLPAHAVHQVRVADGRVFAATDVGLLVFPTRLMDSTHVSPQPFIYNLKSGDRTLDLGLPLQLNYTQNEFQVQFHAITFRKPQVLSYRYRLKGMGDQWSVGEAGTANYSSIPDGQYTFEVQARAANGPWSSSATFALEIFPPFWKQLWFYLLVAFAGLALLALSFFLVIRTIRRRNAVRQRIMQAEHQALITQMNPHFIFNSLNSIQRFFLSHDLEMANDYLADFSALIRAILEIGRETEITLARELEFLRLYIHLEALRLDNQFKHEITVDPELATHQAKIPPMFIQPFVENAIWHGLAPKGQGGLLTVHFRRQGDYLVCTVRDNGIGRKRAGELKAQSKRTYKSLATKITEERLELFNKINKTPIRLDIHDLNDEHGQPAGTEVSVKFPILTAAKS